MEETKSPLAVSTAMTKTAKRRVSVSERDADGEGARRIHSRHGSAVVVLHAGRKFAVVTDHRGLRHAREILRTGILAEEIADEDFETLVDAFPWEV